MTGRDDKITDMQTVVDAELDQLMERYASEGHGPREYHELTRRLEKWTMELQEIFPEDLIEGAAVGTYLFWERKDLWEAFLDSQISRTRRQQVKDVLEAWKSPFILLAEVTGRKDGRIVLQDVQRDSVYTMEEMEECKTGDWLFGLALRDPRYGERGIKGAAVMMIIHRENRNLMEALRDKLDSGDGDLLPLYCLFGEPAESKEYSPLELDILAAVDRYLTDIGEEEETLMQYTELFLTNVPVQAKKPEAVAAGLVAAARNWGLLEWGPASQKDIAAYFGVSAGTLAKYRDQAYDFIDELMSEPQHDQSRMVREIGTDPFETEQPLWEILKRAEHQEIQSEKDLQELLQTAPDHPFQPKTDEERAQLLCFQAYDAASDKERYRLAEKAALLAPDLPDVRLLLAEQTQDYYERSKHYLYALNEGLRRMKRDTPSEDAYLYIPNRPALRAFFAYGTWLLTIGRADEAIEQFKYLAEIHPSDQMGSKWLLASALLTAGKLNEAGALLQELDLFIMEGVHACLGALHEAMQEGCSREEAVLRLVGVQPFQEEAALLLQQNRHPGEFPRKLLIGPGTAEEARFIYWLLYWPLQMLESKDASGETKQ